MLFNPFSVDEIVEGKLYLGSIDAATSVATRERLRITHVVSVCPDYPSTGAHHICLPVHDSEHTDILSRLRPACEFIEDVLKDDDARVLVHCLMGVSRSATVVCAYLMKTRKLSYPEAFDYVLARRPRVMPNDGFREQLEVFAACNYEPTLEHKAVLAWNATREMSITKLIDDTVPNIEVIPNRLFLNGTFHENRNVAERLACFLVDFGICHVLALPPSGIPTPTPSEPTLPFGETDPAAVPITDVRGDKLVLADDLLDARDFVVRTLHGEPDAQLEARADWPPQVRLMIHCTQLERASVVACAYLMKARQLAPREAWAVLSTSRAAGSLLPAPTQLHWEMLDLLADGKEDAARRAWLAQPT